MLILASCADPAREEKVSENKTVQTDTLEKSNSSEAYAAKDVEEPTPVAPTVERVRKPEGLYQLNLPYMKGRTIEHTIRFDADNTYKLQERYQGGQDSVVITQGTWAPSNGYLWLYKEQVVLARYLWKGNTLEYFDPLSKKSMPMQALMDASTLPAWKSRSIPGLLYAGTGNEPFWNFEARTDSIYFMLAEWGEKRQYKVSETHRSGDSTIFIASGDSAKLRVAILPYTCSDGMSDYTYPNTVFVNYNGTQYKGCAVRYRQ